MNKEDFQELTIKWVGEYGLVKKEFHLVLLKKSIFGSLGSLIIVFEIPP